MLLLGPKNTTRSVTVPEAFVLAFAEKKSEVRAIMVPRPHPLMIWLQEMANIQFKLEYDQLSPKKRRNLEHQLQMLRDKLEQN